MRSSLAAMQTLYNEAVRPYSTLPGKARRRLLCALMSATLCRPHVMFLHHFIRLGTLPRCPWGQSFAVTIAGTDILRGDARNVNKQWSIRAKWLLQVRLFQLVCVGPCDASLTTLLSSKGTHQWTTCSYTLTTERTGALRSLGDTIQPHSLVVQSSQRGQQ